jgi:ABC-type sugar transport system substrate-binding protein
MRFARLTVLAPLALAFLAAPLAASAQAPQRVFRIGVLTVWPRPPDVTTYAPGFVREMLALGWVEGQHYVRNTGLPTEGPGCLLLPLSSSLSPWT